jgi:hypothetical protein
MGSILAMDQPASSFHTPNSTTITSYIRNTTVADRLECQRRTRGMLVSEDQRGTADPTAVHGSSRTEANTLTITN